MGDQILTHDSKQNERLRNIGRGLGVVMPIDKLKTYIASHTNLSKPQNWEQMSMSTAMGMATIQGAFIGGCFDGRYVYFSPDNYSYPFITRFDTTLLFTNSSAWSTMNFSTAMVSSLSTAGCPCRGACFDGRYLYLSPCSSNTMIRFDTTLSFTNSSAWEKMNMSTVSQHSDMRVYSDVCFDGRYVYLSPETSLTFIRYDTTLSFTNSSAWERMNTSTVIGASISNIFRSMVFDGRYIHYTPIDSASFAIFDTTGAFNTSSSWSVFSVSTAQGGGAVTTGFGGSLFDGRYVYHIPQNSDTFLRFDTTRSFTNSSAWERINMSTAQGGAALDTAYFGPSKHNGFDGRYVYIPALNSDTFIRFDTTLSFTNSSAWEKMNMSTAQGAATLDVAYAGVVHDGKYEYFMPFYSDTFVRVLACPNKEMRQ